MTRIRLATPADASAVAEIYRPYVAEQCTSFELVTPTAAVMAERITTCLERMPWLICEYADGIVGYAYAGKHRDRWGYQWSCEVSAYVESDTQRCGVARGLYTSLFEILALQGYKNAYAGITLPNHASVSFHKALGFTPVGVYHKVGYKFGAWHDTMWLERELGTKTIDPAPPTLLTELLGNSNIDGACRGGETLIHL